MLPVISARMRFMCFLLFGWRSAVRALRTVPTGKASVCGLVAVLRVVVAMIANQADIHADEEREDEGLHETDQELEKVEGNGQTPARDGRHRVEEIFTSEHVAEQA